MTPLGWLFLTTSWAVLTYCAAHPPIMPGAAIGGEPGTEIASAHEQFSPRSEALGAFRTGNTR